MVYKLSCNITIYLPIGNQSGPQVIYIYISRYHTVQTQNRLNPFNQCTSFILFCNITIHSVLITKTQNLSNMFSSFQAIDQFHAVLKKWSRLHFNETFSKSLVNILGINLNKFTVPLKTCLLPLRKHGKYALGDQGYEQWIEYFQVIDLSQLVCVQFFPFRISERTKRPNQIKFGVQDLKATETGYYWVKSFKTDVLL